MTRFELALTLNFSFVDSTIDLGEVEKLKEQILNKDALVAKLVLP